MHQAPIVKQEADEQLDVRLTEEERIIERAESGLTTRSNPMG
ncbi:MAG: hypothetical protein R3D26_20620 [Cyanobacteriota/Melainabacteria group bacterium]